MEFSELEMNVILYAVRTIKEQGWQKHGTLTAEIAAHVASKLRFRGYCERHGITYEQMTEDDFEEAYREETEA